MTRIGIFMDPLQGSIPSSFRERVASYARGLPNVAFCREEEDLTSPEDKGNGKTQRLSPSDLQRALHHPPMDEALGPV